MNDEIKYASFYFFILIFITFSSSYASSSGGILKYDRGVIISLDSIKVKIELVSPVIIHVESSPAEFSKIGSLVVNTDNFPVPRWSVKETRREVKVETDSLLVRFSRATGNLKFYKNGVLILSESGRTFGKDSSDKGKGMIVGQTFHISQGEALYGLGQHQNGDFNYRNKSVDLVQDNTEVAVPFLVSTNKYGILWDNYSETRFSDGPGGTSFRSEIGDQINYYFIYGRNMDGIISQYRNLTGQVPLYPKWAYGYFQSRNRYRTRAELMNTVVEYRSLSIPLDVIVLDYLHWGKYGFGSFRFDESSFPDPRQMIDSLHKNYNCKIMVSVWPSFSKNTPNWEKMKSNGYLLNVNSYDDSQVYDAYNPSAGKALLESS